MKIREGAYYRTFGGEIAGPMKRSEVSPTEWLSGGRGHWTDFGLYCHSTAPEDVWDLVREVYVSDMPPAPQVNTTKTARDELVEKAALEIFKRFYLNPEGQEGFDWMWRAAENFVEARKK